MVYDHIWSSSNPEQASLPIFCQFLLLDFIAFRKHHQWHIKSLPSAHCCLLAAADKRSKAQSSEVLPAYKVTQILPWKILVGRHYSNSRSKLNYCTKGLWWWGLGNKLYNLIVISFPTKHGEMMVLYEGDSRFELGSVYKTQSVLISS